MNAFGEKIRDFFRLRRPPILARVGLQPIVHEGATGTGSHPFVIVTPAQRWAYAASWPIQYYRSKVPDGIRVVVRLSVLGGRVGIGIVASDKSTYLSERQAASENEIVEIAIPADWVDDAQWLVVRNTATGGEQSKVAIQSIVFEADQTSPAASIREATLKPFKPKALRTSNPKVASINTTDICNLSCVMCHFNGPNATKKADTLSRMQVEKVLRDIPSGDSVWFCATGEFFIDPNATYYLRQATSLGLKPCVLTHGQLFTPALIDEVLDAGVRLIRMSVDSTDPDQYRKIRRGGELSRILEACTYLRGKKSDYPDLRVEINATLFKTTFAKQREMEEFWRPLVDQVNFNAEYFNTFQFRNTFYIPDRRVDCDIEIYVMPSGRIVPCCAMAVYQHDHDVSWLPHIDEVSSLDEAYKKMCDLYEDPEGPMAPICAKCDWWIMFMHGNSPYIRSVDLNESVSVSKPAENQG